MKGTMKIVAEKKALEFSDESIKTTNEVYEVSPGETVEDLLLRAGVTGSSRWHYSQVEVVLKLVVPNNK